MNFLAIAASHLWTVLALPRVASDWSEEGPTRYGSLPVEDGFSGRQPVPLAHDDEVGSG